MSHLLEIRNLSKTYPAKTGPVHAVQDVTLCLPEGQILGLLGTNGAGKTTTIKMICGLVTPSSGSIKIAGMDIHQNRAQVMRKIGVVLEGTRNIYWRLSAWHNLMYFGRLKGLHGKIIRERAEHLLHEMGLWERRHDNTGKFSRGMQQKVAIAAALMADPPLLLLDEPTLGLDVQAARYVRDLMLKLASEQGKTIILTTHQLDVAQSVCDRIAIMRRGKVLTDRSKDSLMALFSQEIYELRIGGHLPALNGLHPVYDNQETIFSGAIASQNELYVLLDKIRESGLPLISVQKKTPSLEDVFIHVVEHDRSE